MEGSLFLLRRRRAPRFQLMILNKLTTGEEAPLLHAAVCIFISNEPCGLFRICCLLVCKRSENTFWCSNHTLPPMPGNCRGQGRHLRAALLCAFI